MNVKSSSRVFQLVFFFGYGYIVRLSECLSISAVYGESDVEFTCVISPYNGNQQWKIDSTVVAGCGAVSCSEVLTNPERYSFTPNLTSGIFVFKIDSINSTDDKTNVGCSNGTETKTLAITISDNSHVTDDDGCIIDSMDISFMVFSSVARIYAIQILLSYLFYRYVQDEPEGKCKAVVISSFPILGFFPVLKVKFFGEVPKKGSWKKMARVFVILIGGPSVAVFMIFLKYVKTGHMICCIHLESGCSRYKFLLILFIFGIGSAVLTLEIIYIVSICQDDKWSLRLAILLLEVFSFVALVISFIFFLAGYLSCCADLCHKNHVENGTHPDPNESGRSNANGGF